VATCAADAGSDVYVVREVGIIGEKMDVDPLDGLVCGKTVAHGLQQGAFGLDRGVAVHAGLAGGYVGKAGGLDAGVTITAIHAKLPGMQPVAIRDGLPGRVADVRILWREVIPDEAYSAKSGTPAEENQDQW
jgi:hypothetical protein